MVDSGVNSDPYAEDLAELLDMVRLDELGVDTSIQNWLHCRGFQSTKHAIACLVTALPKGATICLK